MITMITLSEVSVSTTIGLSGLKMCQDGGLGEGSLEGFERLGVVRAPSEQGVLAGEANQGMTMSENPTMNQR